MKKRMISAALALCLLPAPGVPVLADGGTRLTGVNVYVDGELALQYTYTYADGPLPASGRMHPLTERTIYVDGEAVQSVPPDTVWAYTYDGEGRLVRSEAVIDDGSGSGSATTNRWEYNADGRLTRDEWINAAAADGAATNYIYDEDGRLVRSADEDEYGIIRDVNEYDCDEAGRVTSSRLYFVMDWDAVGEPTVWGPDPVSEIRYGYDEAGRMGHQANYYDGGLTGESYYTYGEDPYFTVRYGEISDYQNNEIENETYFILYDAADRQALSFAMPGTPELTRDEAGRLVKAETENRYMEFIYE